MTCPAGGAHHFVIAPARGLPTSLGTCSKCGEQREHRNWVDDWFGAQPCGKGKFRPMWLRPSDRGLDNSQSIHAVEMRGFHEEEAV